MRGLAAILAALGATLWLTAPISGRPASDPPRIVQWHLIGDAGLGMSSHA